MSLQNNVVPEGTFQNDKLPGAMAPWTNYTEQQRKDIEEMAEWQASQSPVMSDRRFCMGSPYTETTWSRVKRGIYQGKLDDAIRALKRHVVNLSEARMRARSALKSKFFKTGDYSTMEEAIKVAQAVAEDGGQDKLVCYVGDFGCGKTTLATHLCDENNGVLVEAMPSWKVSYYAVCRTIAEAVGLKKKFMGAAHAEMELIAQLKLHPRTLFFEEVEYTGAQLLNLWKMILNQTQCTVVVFFITRFFNELRRRGGEYADQLLRRANVIEASPVTASLASRFLAEHWKITPELREAAQLLANAANGKGGLHLCSRVAKMLHSEFQDEPPTFADVEAKIGSYQLMKQYSTTTAGA